MKRQLSQAVDSKQLCLKCGLKKESAKESGQGVCEQGEFMLKQRSTQMVSVTVLDCQNSGKAAHRRKIRKTATVHDSSSPFKQCLEIFYFSFWRLLVFMGKVQRCY